MGEIRQAEKDSDEKRAAAQKKKEKAKAAAQKAKEMIKAIKKLKEGDFVRAKATRNGEASANLSVHGYEIVQFNEWWNVRRRGQVNLRLSQDPISETYWIPIEDCALC